MSILLNKCHTLVSQRQLIKCKGSLQTLHRVGHPYTQVHISNYTAHMEHKLRTYIQMSLTHPIPTA